MTDYNDLAARFVEIKHRWGMAFKINESPYILKRERSTTRPRSNRGIWVVRYADVPDDAIYLIGDTMNMHPVIAEALRREIAKYMADSVDKTIAGLWGM